MDTNVDTQCILLDSTLDIGIFGHFFYSSINNEKSKQLF